jgi:hypothetical protein
VIDSTTKVLSRHSSGNLCRWEVEGRDLNTWCRLPGNPLTRPLVLMANRPDAPATTACFRPTGLPPQIDTFTAFFRTSQNPSYDHAQLVTLRVVDDEGRVHDRSTLRLAEGARAHATLQFQAGTPGPGLEIRVALEGFGGGDHHGNLRLVYLLAYESNPLVSLCNRAGTDKGTEAFSGNGVPHCYAIEYHELFAPFRDERFALLEIGLDDASKLSGKPLDAPSLRVWRDYFPAATLYGYDINDFAGFEQERTVTFRGDQGSRQDLERFIVQHDQPMFRLVIDDGSHASSHQQTSLAALFRQVEPGGMYVIEDLGWQPFPEEPRTIDVLAELHESGRVRSPFIPADDARYLERTVSSVEVHRPNDSPFAVIRKRAG